MIDKLTPAMLYAASVAAEEFPTDNCRYKWESRGYD